MCGFWVLRPSIFLVLTLLTQCISSFSLPNNPQSHSEPLLLGDAKFISGAGGSSGSAVELTDSNSGNPSGISSGFLVWAKPIRFLTPDPVSFSADFTFSISSENAVGLAFVIVPADFPAKFSREGPEKGGSFRVEFGSLVGGNGDAKKMVGVSVKSLVPSKMSNVSKASLISSEEGSRLRSWIDYDASSKRLEIRLGGFGSAKPYAPFIACGVDFSAMWKTEEVLMVLSSTSEKHLQSSVVHSWNVKARNVPKGLHSKPVNPDERVRDVVNPQLSGKGGKEKKEVTKRSCVLGFLSGLIFVTGCAALIAFVVLSLWAISMRNEEVVVIPSKCVVHPRDVRYEKISVVVEDNKNGVKSQSF